MPDYKVRLTRTIEHTVVLTINAMSKADAHAMAQDQAGDVDFAKDYDHEHEEIEVDLEEDL